MDGPLDDLAARLPSGMVGTHHGELAAHARDRWALAILREARGHRIPPPAAVVYPRSTEHVLAVLAWARETGTPVVARGAGTGLAGGAEALKRCVVIEMSGLDRIVGLDAVSQTISAQAGVRGAEVEAELAKHGLTLGFDPVTLHASTVGGWIGSGAVGVASRFGAIRDLVVGLTAVTSDGEQLDLRPIPRTAGGPDLRGLLVGSEGTMGIVTEATLAVTRAPADVRWSVFTLNSFDGGVALAREIAQRPFRPLAVRLHDAAAAAASFGAFGFLDRPLLFVGMDGQAPGGEVERSELSRLAREFGAREGDPDAARQWWDRRFEGLSWHEEAMGPERASGTVVDTADVAAVWRRLPRVYEEVRGALLEHADTVTCLLVDPSSSGAALLFMFWIRAEDDDQAEVAYLAAWDAVARAVLGAGGTIAHGHGIGLLKAPFLEGELGGPGAAVFRRVLAAMDPAGILNPGKLLPGVAAQAHAGGEPE